MSLRSTASYAHDSFNVSVSGLESLPAGVVKLRTICQFKLDRYAAIRHDFNAYTSLGYRNGTHAASTTWTSSVSLNTHNYIQDAVLTIVVETELPSLPTITALVTYFGLVLEGTPVFRNAQTFLYKDGKWATIHHV